MKKVIVMLLVGLMVLSSFSVLYAEEPASPVVQTTTKLELLKAFNAEIHQINAVRTERNLLQNQVIEKQDKLADLIVAAKENKNKEALTAVKEQKKQLKAINDEIKALHEQAAAAHKAFREALKNKDEAAARQQITSCISLNASINAKIQQKAQILDTIINLLS